MVARTFVGMVVSIGERAQEDVAKICVGKSTVHVECDEREVLYVIIHERQLL